MKKQIKVTAMTVFVTDIPVRLMRRHGSGDVAGSVKNAILKLETDAGITGWGDAAPWAVFTGTIEANVAALNVYLRPLLVGADPFRIEALMGERASGVYQLTGPRDVSYVDVGRFLADKLGAGAALVTPASVADANLPPGIGPAHTTLDSSALRARFGIVVPDAWSVLDGILREMEG